MDAQGKAIDTLMPRQLLADLRKQGLEPVNVVLHPELQCEWEGLGILVSCVDRRVLSEYCSIEALGTTMMGVPVVARMDMPNTIIEFRGPKDELLGAIYNLKAPEIARL